ncbi:MAG: ATP-binding cassette domain-containing protein [Spirochaetales bacterium]|nr:ATP-binding cassette domain-containing protein [Spirochaetales bacterium]
MAFISLQDIYLSYGEHPLLDNINLHIERDQRICLMGRNGTGKSTLMKIMAGVLEPDAGKMSTDSRINVSYFEQEIPASLGGLVFDVIADAFTGNANELKACFREDSGIKDGRNFPDLQPDRVHTPENWEVLQRIKRMAQELGLDCKSTYNSLSGGQKRRVLLAAAIVTRPDLLLLDEPTNHLDIRTISWLEEYIIQFCPTVLFVTHDRAFLKRLATRIVELDRGSLFDYHCSYDQFLERRQAWLEAQEKEWANFDRKLSEEEVWLRKGIRARRTRNEGRVKALWRMREERRQRRTLQGSAKLAIGQDKKSGKIVVEARNVSFAYDKTQLIKDFSLLINRGDKIGIVGANGCGKTTLVNLLIGKLVPSAGTVRTGANLSIVFFDQMRSKIDPDKTVQDNVAPNGETVTVNGKTRHIISYLQDFLFSADRARSPVAHLSGGECNRLLLAKMFTQPCNFLVMDEPTNDLDAETLELLEDLIVEFDGTALIISHDRMFLNNTTSGLLVFGTDGNISEITGGYDDWLACAAKNSGSGPAPSTVSEKGVYKKERTKTRLSYNEQKELDGFPARIEQLEARIEELYRVMSDPLIFQDAERIRSARQQLEEAQNTLKESYRRWEALETEAEALAGNE